MVKPASSIAAGMLPHEIAYGDVVGVSWIYDIRKPDIPRLRLPCGSGHAVTSVQWLSMPTSLHCRSSTRRVQVPSSSHFPGKALFELGSQSAKQESQSIENAGPASALTVHTVYQSVNTARPVSESLTDKSSESMVRQKDGGETVQCSTTITMPSATNGVADLPLQNPYDGVGNERQRSHLEESVRENMAVGSESAGILQQLRNPSIPHELKGVGDLTEAMVTRIVEANQAVLQKQIEDIESRILGRVMALNTSDGPLFHTKQITQHVDNATEVMKSEIQGWLAAQQRDTLKQFHLAQQDLMDVAQGLNCQISALASSLEQLQTRINADEENRRKVTQFM